MGTNANISQFVNKESGILNYPREITVPVNADHSSQLESTYDGSESGNTIASSRTIIIEEGKEFLPISQASSGTVERFGI